MIGKIKMIFAASLLLFFISYYSSTEINAKDVVICLNDIEAEYSLSQDEIDLIALITMGEAEGETELGKRLVIDTILNRLDSPDFPNSVYDVIYQPAQFSVVWNNRLDSCFVDSDVVDLVKEELSERTNTDVIFFMAGDYSSYGTPLFKECCHYFSSCK